MKEGQRLYNKEYLFNVEKDVDYKKTESVRCKARDTYFTDR